MKIRNLILKIKFLINHENKGIEEKANEFLA